ncbi:MAG: DUF3800 domain-containing protein [Chitinophagales bacterium]
MNFEIYCDESRQEVLTDNSAHRYMAIGGIWMKSEYRETFKNKMNAIKKKHSIYGELKWNKISPTYLDLYKEIVEYFFSTNSLRFRVIIINSKKVNNLHFNSSDNELSFYKFYYQLIHHWIFDFNNYQIFLDYKINRDSSRLQVLKNVLNNSNLSSSVDNVQAIPSEQSLGIQLADILTGVVSAKFNNKTTSNAKRELTTLIEDIYIKIEISPTPKWEEKFNIFKITLKGGW